MVFGLLDDESQTLPSQPQKPERPATEKKKQSIQSRPVGHSKISHTLKQIQKTRYQLVSLSCLIPVAAVPSLETCRTPGQIKLPTTDDLLSELVLPPTTLAKLHQPISMLLDTLSKDRAMNSQQVAALETQLDFHKAIYDKYVCDTYLECHAFVNYTKAS